MTIPARFAIDPRFDLVLERTVDVPKELVWKAWTTPDLLKQWFTPAPWKTIDAEIDLRPGGMFRTTMLSPEGQEFPNLSCCLEVVPNELLVMTDTLGPGYRPAANPFFTAIVLFESDGKGGTRYTAIARHGNEETRVKHEEMGFHDGWGKAWEQLVALARTL